MVVRWRLFEGLDLKINDGVWHSRIIFFYCFIQATLKTNTNIHYICYTISCNVIRYISQRQCFKVSEYQGSQDKGLTESLEINRYDYIDWCSVGNSSRGYIFVVFLLLFYRFKAVIDKPFEGLLPVSFRYFYWGGCV